MHTKIGPVAATIARHLYRTPRPRGELVAAALAASEADPKEVDRALLWMMRRGVVMYEWRREDGRGAYRLTGAGRLWLRGMR